MITLTMHVNYGTTERGGEHIASFDCVPGEDVTKKLNRVLADNPIHTVNLDMDIDETITLRTPSHTAPSVRDVEYDWLESGVDTESDHPLLGHLGHEVFVDCEPTDHSAD